MQKRKRDTDVQQTLGLCGEGKGGMFWENSIETSILLRVKQVTSPGWMHETSAQGWCTGKTQRDGVGREAGGGSGWGTHVNPWLIHVNVWQKPLQYCKVISLRLIKKKKKKKDQLKTQEEKHQSVQCKEQSFSKWTLRRGWYPGSLMLAMCSCLALWQSVMNTLPQPQ